MKENSKILVGISGGVDSAMATFLLRQQGYEVITVFFEMLKNDDDGRKQAYFIANQLSVPLLVKNIRDDFQDNIISEFIKSYENGFTPNPCVICNPQIKFKYLLNLADELGINKVATGHYAKIKSTFVSNDDNVKRDNKGKIFSLNKARDELKDQSYFLHRLTLKELRRIIFPLGDLLKEEVKKIAQRQNIEIPSSESQDVCFLKNESGLKSFFLKNKPEILKTGDIIDENGKKIGQHQGLPIYTIGQRKNLNIGGDGPFYVMEKDIEKNILKVTRNKKDLNKRGVIISNINWISNQPEKNKIYQIKIRYQMKSVDAKLFPVDLVKEEGEGNFKRKIEHKNEMKNWKVVVKERGFFQAVAPGQSLVVYDDDQVIGGGIIVK